MYLLEIRKAYNPVQITQLDRFEEAQATALFDEMQMRQKERDFLVLFDLTTLRKFSPSARSHLRAVMSICMEAGLREIIRIIPDPLTTVGLTLMSHIHDGRSVNIATSRASWKLGSPRNSCRQENG